MVTIAHLTEKIIEQRPFLQEALSRGIINYGALADTLIPEIEKELKKKVKHAAVMMALRRLSAKLEKSFITNLKFDKNTDITIKSNLFEMTVKKDKDVNKKIRQLYNIVDLESGDILTITHGHNEITIISNTRYKKEFLKIFSQTTRISVIDNLSSLSMNIPVQLVETRGMLYLITRALAWDNINIVEVVSTYTELTVIISEDDVTRAFSVLRELIQKNK